LAGFKKWRQGPTDAAGAFTVIRRVVPTAGGFFCGICRAVHPTWTAAELCVASCWSAQLQAQPTVAIRKGMFTLHRCRFCKREYPDFVDAANCAAQCSEDLIAQSNREANETTQDIIGLDKLPALPKKFKYTIDATSVSPLAMQQMVRTVLMPFQVRNALHNQQAMTPILNAVMKSASGIAIGKRSLGKSHHDEGVNMAHDSGNKPQTGATPVNKDPNKKFFRDGARYVCSVCRTKFFTKLEVESCWEKH
jgi:hypothetical protein